MENGRSTFLSQRRQRRAEDNKHSVVRGAQCFWKMRLCISAPAVFPLQTMYFCQQPVLCRRCWKLIKAVANGLDSHETMVDFQNVFVFRVWTFLRRKMHPAWPSFTTGSIHPPEGTLRGFKTRNLNMKHQVYSFSNIFPKSKETWIFAKFKIVDFYLPCYSFKKWKSGPVY